MHQATTLADDDIVFPEQTAAASHSAAQVAASGAWRILIIDRDREVHSAAGFALNHLEVLQRPLQVLHAYSASEAHRLLEQERDIALILLDACIEPNQPWLQLVRHIRGTLRLSALRVILRLAHSEQLPDISEIGKFDISDCKGKADLTRLRLYPAVAAAIRTREQIRAVESSRRGLELIARAGTELMKLEAMHELGAGVIAQTAALLGVAPHGILCTQEHTVDGNGELTVIAAAGNYERHADGLQVADKLARVFGERRNIYGDEFAALHLSGSGNRDFALVLDTGRAVDDIERSLLEVMCCSIAARLDNVLLVTRMHSFAFYDPLTKLPNRTRLKEILNQALDNSSRRETTLALVDIDHFSETNDALGHQFGDLLLLGVTARLQSQLGNLGGRVTIGRVGGDTFGVLGHSERVNPTAIQELFEKPFSIDGHDVQLSATVGLLRLADYEGSGVDAIKDADIALKRAKLRQRAGHFYFSRSMGVDIRERVRIMHALRAAFEEKKLFVVYQPQIDLTTRRAVGAEALLRWKTADGTFISPARFVAIAEYSGLIIEIGGWVMREACRAALRLQQLGFDNFKISVNVSQVQFRHPRFLEMLRGALQETQTPPGLIELEITESIAMEEPAALIRLLDQIRQTGITIAIDDFGTGFSSLSYLQRLQADKLKIDRAFVSEITDSARGSSIAEMVVQLGRNLGLSVIAEGVENEHQAGKLASLGCPLAQGYLFARPMTEERLTGWLRKNA